METSNYYKMFLIMVKMFFEDAPKILDDVDELSQ